MAGFRGGRDNREDSCRHMQQGTGAQPSAIDDVALKDLRQHPALSLNSSKAEKCEVPAGTCDEGRPLKHSKPISQPVCIKYKDNATSLGL
jgi:hypothetical protein